MNTTLVLMLAAMELPEFFPGQTVLIPVAAFLLGLLVGGLAIVRRRRRRGTDRECQRPAVPPLRGQMPLFMAEVDRARRYERGLAVLVLKLEDPDTVGAALGLVDSRVGHGMVSEKARALVQSARQVMFWNIGYVLKDLLRENDVAACDVPEMRYIVLLPEAAEDEAQRAATRLGERLFSATGVHVRQGVSVYRQDGLTIDHLVESATSMSERTVSGRRANESQARTTPLIKSLPKQGGVS